MKHLLTFGIIVLFSLPMLTFAATATTGVVPCGGTGQPVCQACYFVQLGQNLLDWFITAMASVIALVFAWGGMKMVMSGGSGEGISEARGMMTNSIIGFLILLSAYLIVDTVLKTFLNEPTSTGIGPWNKIDCVTQPAKVPQVPPPGEGPGPTLPPGTVLADAGARTALDAINAAAGSGSGKITVNKTEAQGTSLENMRAETLQTAINLRGYCNCDIVITAGTESTGGHSTTGVQNHENGYKYDMRPNDTLDRYIIKNYAPMVTRSDGAAQYRDNLGNIYAREKDAVGGDHWDVLVPGR